MKKWTNRAKTPRICPLCIIASYVLTKKKRLWSNSLFIRVFCGLQFEHPSEARLVEHPVDVGTETGDGDGVAGGVALLQEGEEETQTTAADVFQAGEIEHDTTVTAVEQLLHVFFHLEGVRGVKPTVEIHHQTASFITNDSFYHAIFFFSGTKVQLLKELKELKELKGVKGHYFFTFSLFHLFTF